MKKNLLKLVPILSLLAFFPLIAFAIPVDPAPACGSPGGLGKMICQIHQILNSIIPVLVALGLVYFVWGVVRYVIADGEEAKKKGKDIMVYGVIGFAVIIGLWGLVLMVVKTFDLEGTARIVSDTTCDLGPDPDFQKFIGYLTCMISGSVIPLIFALAVVMFVWGIVQFFLIGAGEEAKRAQGRQFMIWGVIALTVMLSIWGLVQIVGSTFGVGSVIPKVCPPTDPQCLSR